ncbi:hypothetical protein HOY82DRAFT_615649 [Tuber indicum]|nr:hypothetical protein HOY82DRAFT_615649 [Tuber indicum]
MGRKRPPGRTFTGNNGIGIKTVLNRMKTWFAMMEDDFNGVSVAARRQRAAQIRVACPLGSQASTFIDQLQQEDKRLRRYYIDGLTSQHLCKLPSMSFMKPDLKETPYQVKAWRCEMVDQSDNDTEGESSSNEDVDSNRYPNVERTYNFSKKFVRKSKSMRRHLQWKSKHKSKKEKHIAQSYLIRNEFK